MILCDHARSPTAIDDTHQRDHSVATVERSRYHPTGWIWE
jgi:hypothetical protein